MRVEELKSKGVPAEVVAILRNRGIEELTETQRAAVQQGALDGKSVVISAPTSAGKTLVGELVAAKNAGTGLTVFLVSHKALAREVYEVVKKWYVDEVETPFLKPGILTGDVDTVRGDWSQFHFVVSTYEKLYGTLVTSPEVLGTLRTVVADELQTLGSENRGQLFELLLALLMARKKQRPQIIGLSATTPNSSALAEWLEAEHVRVERRYPPLEQEIWLPNRRLVYRVGAEEPDELDLSLDNFALGEAVRWLLDNEHGPVAVMATTKPKVHEFAGAIAAVCPVSHDLPEAVVNEFRAHGDAEETTESCIELLRRGVGVHYADLTHEQRAVVERAFYDRYLSVIVATPTIVAGVNLPIRTVVYPQLTRWKPTGEDYIPLEEYLNGAGRAGRLGMHEKGTVVMWAESIADARQIAKRFVFGEPGVVESQMEGRSPEFLLLHLLAIVGRGKLGDVVALASKTLWGYERKLGAKKKLRDEQEEKFRRIVQGDRLTACWEVDGDNVSLSAIGKAIVRSGVEPAEVLEAYEEVKRSAASAEEKGVIDLLCRMCACDCMVAVQPYEAKMRERWASWLNPILAGHFPSGRRVTYRQVVMAGQVLLASKAMDLPEWPAAQMRGNRAERVVASERLAHLLRAACAVADAADAVKYEATVKRVQTLAEQLEFQISAQAVALARVFAQHRVPNVGPARIAKLAASVDGEVGRVLELEDDQMGKAVGPKQVAGVRKAIVAYLRGLTKERSERQLSEASASAAVHGLVEPVLRLRGTKVERPLANLLNALGWDVEPIEQAGEGAKPDVAGKDDEGTAVIVECKTTEDLAGEVSRKEAFDVVRKVPTGFAGHVYTMGRPTFADAGVEHALKERAKWPHVRLVTIGGLVELLLAVKQRGMRKSDACAVLRRYTHVGTARVRDEESRLGSRPGSEVPPPAGARHPPMNVPPCGRTSPRRNFIPHYASTQRMAPSAVNRSPQRRRRPPAMPAASTMRP